MKRKLARAALFFLIAGFAAGARADLDDFLRSVNVQARTDMHDFTIKVAAQFGVPEAQVQAVIRRVDSASDVFMVFQIGHWTGRPPGEVVSVYGAHKGKGWGVIAKELGIRPGSPEFHALRRGDLVFSGRPGASPQRGAGKGKGKGRGKTDE
jgi:hypothetical protein